VSNVLEIAKSEIASLMFANSFTFYFFNNLYLRKKHNRVVWIYWWHTLWN